MKARMVVAVSLTLLASVALATTPALAQRGGGMGRGGGGTISGSSGGSFVGGRGPGGGAFVAGRGPNGAFIAGRGPGGRSFVAGSRAFPHGRDGFHRHPFFHRGFNSFGTVVVYGAPYYWPYYDTPYPYYDPSLAYTPPVVYGAPYSPPMGGQLSLTPPPSPPDTQRGAVSDRTLRAARRRRHGAVPLGVDPESSHGAAVARAADVARAAELEGSGTHAPRPAVPLDRRAGNHSLHRPLDCRSGSVPRPDQARRALLIPAARGGA
jgi:hypothetical protein